MEKVKAAPLTPGSVELVLFDVDDDDEFDFKPIFGPKPTAQDDGFNALLTYNKRYTRSLSDNSSWGDGSSRSSLEKIDENEAEDGISMK